MANNELPFETALPVSRYQFGLWHLIAATTVIAILIRIVPAIGSFWTILLLVLPWISVTREWGVGHPIALSLAWFAATLGIVLLVGYATRTTVLPQLYACFILPPAAYLAGFVTAMDEL